MLILSITCYFYQLMKRRFFTSINQLIKYVKNSFFLRMFVHDDTSKDNGHLTVQFQKKPIFCPKRNKFFSWPIVTETSVLKRFLLCISIHRDTTTHNRLTAILLSQNTMSIRKMLSSNRNTNVSSSYYLFFRFKRIILTADKSLIFRLTYTITSLL